MSISDVSSQLGGSIQRTSSSVPSPSASSASGGGTGRAIGGTTGGIADSVSLSPLASSLRDESLTAFNALSAETRTQLSSLVDSGKLTGEDVHNALKQRLKESRLTAYSATFRMAHNDNAGLFSSDDTTSDDFRKALSATSAKREELMGKLSLLDQRGQGASEQYGEISTSLIAQGTNPALLLAQSGNQRMNLDPFQGFSITQPADSRMAYTRKEADAAYKLKDAGVDLSSIDKALRSLGERDAASLIAERTGQPSTHTVAQDREFTSDDSLFPSISLPATQARTDAPVMGQRVQLREEVMAAWEAMQKSGVGTFEDAKSAQQYREGIRVSY
ncbi:hypothetical protein JJL56_12720 [Azospirillum sp. YIM DDC1]|uniref:Uncharacterized protein n=1 Tax=Azospirillum aestuarii TaxID=2802052 RepID=A0ABS1HY56_9PROT|nr:hypothetical protein [Azospirillum aestuarii]MBK3773840.1 hypothetical protein [Azospirillum brasilense]MBK4719736.1 hypothetical protein [Azospirillum aestuarii]